MKKRYKFLQQAAVFLFLLLLSSTAFAQYTVTGTVRDAATDELLIGVNIFDNESGRGTTTDLDGRFSLELPDGPATLRISFIGYVTQNIDVDADTGELNIELEADVANLEEVVVTGLASTVKRANLANSVSTITAEDIAGKNDPQTLDRSLYGKVPGIQIQSTSGAPGGGFNVQLRGISTLGAGSSQPLYIVDGVYVNNSAFSTGRSLVNGAGGTSQDDPSNRIADLNPEDIESVEVLKGPSAAAIYGQRANAGVIIIKTKRGQVGDTKVNFSQQVGFNDVLKLLGRTQWNEDRIVAFWDDPDTPGIQQRAQDELSRFRQAQANGTIRDLEKEFFGNHGVISNTTLSISGGDEKTRFFVSGAINDEEGIIDNTGFNRKSIRANLDHNISQKVRVSSNSNYISTSNQRGFTGNQNDTGGALTYNLAFHPNYSYGFLQQRADGTYPDSPYFGENPFRLVDVAQNDQDIDRFIQSFSLDADLFELGSSKLALTAQGGFDLVNVNSIIYFPEFMQFQKDQPFPGDVFHRTSRTFNTNLQAFLVHTADVASSFGNINFSTQAGFARFTTESKSESIRGTGLLPGQTNTDNAAQISTSQGFTETTELGLIGQEQINWEDKVIATLGARFDRSTLLLDQDEYTFYPKASIAVNLTNFEFWDSNMFNQFKLRSAYGETGGVPNFGAIFNSLNSGNIGDRVGSTAPFSDVDPELGPERAKEIEIGLDVGMFDGRIAFEGTYYNKTVEDFILGLDPSPATGVTGIITNAGELENNGVELGLNLSPIRSNNLVWTSRILWWTNDSEMTKLSIPPSTGQALGFVGFGAVRIEEGVSPTAIFGIPRDSDQEKFGGLTKYGDFQPEFQMSFGNDFTVFQDFEFSFLFHWSKGGENLDLYELLLDSGGNDKDFFVGNTAEIDDFPPYFSDTSSFIQDASYIKLREASLYYNVPVSTLNKFFGDTVKRIRLGVSGTNLLMFTDFRGYDPEVNFAGRSTLVQSVSIAPFPSSRKILFSVNLDF